MQRQAFGRYEVFQRISLGGMAEVFRAIHTPSSTMVALKRILPEVSEDEEFIKMFEDEARIASQLEHPYIARCLDFGHVDNEWFIAFEFVAGKDLRALFNTCLKNGEAPPLWFLCYVFGRIAEGLAYAHARKDASGAPVSIVHRDVSLQNIIVSYDGDVKLIDFGIAKAAGKLSRTQVGSIKGKFGYMSPEQVRGLEVDLRADIFALGICLWELIALQRLFNAENELLVIEKVRSLRVEPPSRYNPRCPPELDRIVLKALAKGLDERYRAAKDVYRDLNHVAGAIGGLASREQIAQYMRRAFPDARQGSDGGLAGGARLVREIGNMATLNDKSSSDLDMFEGLGKKAPTARPPAPPPGSRVSAPPPPVVRAPDPMKRTLLGVTAPSNKTPAPASAIPAPSAQPIAHPPAAPGRGTLPQVVAPPARGMSAPPPPPMSARAQATIPTAVGSAAATAPRPEPGHRHGLGRRGRGDADLRQGRRRHDRRTLGSGARRARARGRGAPARGGQAQQVHAARPDGADGATSPPSTSQPASRLTPPPPPPNFRASNAPSPGVSRRRPRSIPRPRRPSRSRGWG